MVQSNKNNPSSPSVLPPSIVDMLVTDVLNKNGVQIDKKSVPPEKKEMLKKMVTDLSEQVNTFVETNKNAAKDSNKIVKQGIRQRVNPGMNPTKRNPLKPASRKTMKPATRTRMRRK